MTATRVRGKLGKTPAKPRARDIAYAAVAATTGTPPRAPVGFGHYQHIDPHGWGMLGNDRYGCHDAATEVLTERGWQAWPDYDCESLLATMHPATRMLEFQAPELLHRYDYDGPMYYADHKSLDFSLTPNHRMLFQPYVIPKPYLPGSAYFDVPRFGEIAEMPARVAIPGCTAGFRGATLETIRIGDRTWQGGDLLNLISLILSDGWVGGSETTWHRLSFCCFRADRRDMVAGLAQRLGIRETVRAGVWEWRDDALADYLRANAFTAPTYRSPFKRVPDIVRVASQAQVESFLDYYGDQSVRGDGRQFYTSSRRMADDLQELLLRIGKRGSIYSHDLKEGGRNIRGRPIQARHPSFTVNEVQRDALTFQPGERGPKTAIDHYSGEVFCATVPNSTLVTRRNGKILVSGNCCVWAGADHETMLLASMNGRPVPPFRPEDALSDYAVVTGFDPATGAGDNGTDVHNALNYRRLTGVRDAHAARHQIGAYVALEPGDWGQLLEALCAFDFVAIGFQFPSTADAQFAAGAPWSYVPGASIDGGHYVPVVGRPHVSMVEVLTWGQTQPMTRSFFHHYADECYGILSLESLNASGVTPEGLDLDRLNAILAAL